MKKLPLIYRIVNRFFAYFIAAGVISHGGTLTNRELNLNNISNPYGLIDLDATIITPGDYAYCRLGNLMSISEEYSIGLDKFNFTALTIGPYSNDSYVGDSPELFLLKNKTSSVRIGFPLASVWSPAFGSYQSVIVPRGYPDPSSAAVLMRKLHFSSAVIDEMTGHIIANSAKKVIVLIHGWNPISDKNAYDLHSESYDPLSKNEFYTLALELEMALQGTDWNLVLYHWEEDADTGPKFLNDQADEKGVINGTQAAEISHQHGQHLGEFLADRCPDIQDVHFISHSAGTWAARSAAKYLTTKTTANIQVSLLDPFVPGAIISGKKITTSSLDKPRIEDLAKIPIANRIFSLENYYSVDPRVPGTHEVFEWNAQISERQDIGKNLEVGSTNAAYVKNSGYGGHSGPIQFYADTVIDADPIYQFSFNSLPGLSGFGVRENNYGWYGSMFMQEPIIEKIEIQGGDEGQVTSLNASVNTRRERLRSQQASGITQFQWQKKDVNGIWQNLSNSPDFSHIVGANLNSLTFNKLYLSDAGDYRVVVTRQVYSSASLTNESAPMHLAVRPATSTGGSAPLAPSNLTATAVSSSQINLSWQDNASNETGFRLERRQGASGSWAQIAIPTTNATAFSDTGLLSNTAYSYQIRAYNSADISSYSNIASVTTKVALSVARTLTIQSTNPASGAYIYLTTDKNGQGDVSTPATRLYNADKVVTLVATDTVGGQKFIKWQRDGVDASLTSVAYVTMDTDHTMTAVYGTAPAARTLTGVTVNGVASITENTSQSYTATATYSDGASLTVTPQWSLSQNGAPATISSNGMFNAGAVTADTLVTVQASYTDNGITKNASKAVTIINGNTSQVYTLGLSVGTHGEVTRTPNQNQFQPGSQVVLRAIQETNYRFTGWGGDAASFGTTNPITVTMNGDKSITANFVYDNLYFGPVHVTIKPDGAAAAGGMWRLDNGAWKGSGVTVVPDSNGDHNIFFSDIPGYTTPPMQAIKIISGQVLEVTGNYVSLLGPGGLQMTLQPESAVAAGAQWRPTGGTYAWQNSGATLQGLPGGTYSIEFKTIAGWGLPTSKSVLVNDGRTSIDSSNYIPPVGTPFIYSLTPSSGPTEGGTVVTIDGANFTPPVAVYFGDIQSSTVNVISATQVTAVAPAHAMGTVSPRVTTAGGEATKSNGFNYGPKFGTNMQLETSIGGSMLAVDVFESRAYVGQGSTLLVLDVTNKSNPVPLGRFVLPQVINDLAVYRGADNRIYAVAVTSGIGQGGYGLIPSGALQVIDTTVPTAMQLVGGLSTGGEAQKVSLKGGLAYVADGFNGLLIASLTDPAKPAKVATIGNLGYCASVLVDVGTQGVIAYMAVMDTGSVKILDVSNPLDVKTRGVYVHNEKWGNIYGLSKKGNSLYIGPGRSAGLVVDVSNLDSPVLVRNLGNYVYGGAGLFVQGNYLYWVSTAGAVVVLDITNPAAPQRVGVTSYNQAWNPLRSAYSNGYVFVANASNGLEIVNVANAQAPIAVSAFRPDTGKSDGLFVLDNQQVLVSSGVGLEFYSLGALTDIHKISSLSSTSYGFAQNGNLLLGTNSIIDITDTTKPVIKGSFQVLNGYTTPAIHSGRPVWAGWKSDFSGGALHIVDVSNPGSPVSYGNCSAPASQSRNVIVNGNRAFLSFQNDGLRVYDLSSPRSPRETGSVGIPDNAGCTAISADGGTAYVTMWDSQYGIQIINVSSAQPLLLGRFLPGEYVNYVTINGNRLIVAAGATGVVVFDITQPRAPVEIARYNTPGSALQAVLSGDRIYVADGSAGIAVLTLQDVKGPDVFILNPVVAGSYTTTSPNLTLGGVATDEKGVSRVIWSNDRGGAGDMIGTENWIVGGIPLLPGPNVITATALDSSGNTGSDTITVTYAPTDTTPPVVSITYPTTADTLMTSQSNAELRGSSGDNISVTSVSWANNRGGSGTAVGTTAWTASSIPLLEGPNIITVTASDTAGMKATAVITVNYATPDLISPSVTISFPTNNPSYDTSSGLLNLSGTASDNRGVSKVTWLNDRGGSGSASGTSIWGVNGMQLQPGLNIVTVTSRDESGNVAEDAIAVTFTQPVPPTISTISDQTVSANTATNPLTFIVGDTTTALSNLTIVGSSSNTVLVPDANIIFGGSEANRTVIVTPAANQSGTSTITVVVSDGSSSVLESFNLTVVATLQPQTITFGALPTKIVGNPPFTLSASASSGLTVSLSIVSGPATLNGGTVTLNGAGTVTVRATQPGDSVWSAALAVDRSFSVLTPYEAFVNYLISASVPANLRGATNDPDADGIPNLLEYALGLAPMTANLTGLPELSVSGGNIILRYKRAHPTLAYVVQTTTELSNPTAWTSVGVTQGTPDTNGYVSATVPLGPAQQFLRLQVTLDTPPTSSLNAYLVSASVPANLQDATDDPDADGVPNLLEYALGLAPMTASRVGLPQLAASSSDLTFAYRRAQTDVTYTVQTTTDLSNPASWTSSGVSQGTPDANGNVTATVPLGAARQFLRLQVTLNP